jgi:hypothetical protein
MYLNEKSLPLISPVRPGEQWFFYWKTSAALWEKHVIDSPVDETIYIPLNWGGHAAPNDSWDFGQVFAERDLGRLIDILTRHGRKYCWLLPIGPSPFLPNGGAPIYAARNLSTSRDGMNLSCLDQDGTIHKMYSHFDPKVFKFYADFVSEFAKLLVSKKSMSSVWAVEYYFHEDEKYKSFFSDDSISFNQGFSRFLKKSFPNGLEINSATEELELKNKFTTEVKQLFLTVAEETLAIFWKGKKNIHVFGSGPRDTIQRCLSEGHSQVFLFQELFTSYVNQMWISTCLLNQEEKKNLFEICINEHFGSSELQSQYELKTIKYENSEEYSPLALVDVFDFESPEVFENNGLKDYLRKNCHWMFYVHNQIDFTPHWIDSSQDRIKFFHAKNMNRLLLAKMLKLFMMGQKIIFDRDGISEDLAQRLQIFYLENSLKLQTVNYISPVQLTTLGEGRFITFEGSKLERQDQQDLFWNHIFKFMKIDHPLLVLDKDVFNFWRIRSRSAHELNYIDVRRVNLYNPTSYKKIVKIQNQKRFAFLRMIDPLKATVKSNSEGVEVELLPQGKIALDFGHYEVST